MFRKLFIFGIIFLFLGINILTAIETGFNNYIVDDEGDGNFTSIQDAIDNASIGDTILVYSGNYSENIVINKSLNIIGIDQEYLNGSDTGNPIIWAGETYIDHTSEVIFSNFSLQGIPDNDKIKVEYTNNSQILNCSADYVLLYYSNGITVKNCEFNTKFDYFASVSLFVSSNNIISDNRCIGGGATPNYNIGICLQASDDNQILNNTCMAEDTINSKGADCGIYVVTSKGNTIEGNICWQSDIGIKIEGSDNNQISKNNIKMNKNKGIHLINSDKNEIVQNNFINNTKHVTFKKCKQTTWNENYWDDHTFSAPKLIFGTIGPFLGLIPWFNIDRHPTTNPY